MSLVISAVAKKLVLGCRSGFVCGLKSAEVELGWLFTHCVFVESCFKDAFERLDRADSEADGHDADGNSGDS